jgi:hypothetical protein
MRIIHYCRTASLLHNLFFVFGYIIAQRNSIRRSWQLIIELTNECKIIIMFNACVYFVGGQWLVEVLEINCPVRSFFIFIHLVVHFFVFVHLLLSCRNPIYNTGSDVIGLQFDILDQRSPTEAAGFVRTDHWQPPVTSLRQNRQSRRISK